LNGEENKTNKIKRCTVPIEKAQELCPDPRIFNCCVRSLSMCNSNEEMREKLESWNKFCEENKCPYLKEGKDKVSLDAVHGYRRSYGAGMRFKTPKT
jgi:hypothetical protein